MLSALLASLPMILLGQEGNYKFENFGNQSVLLNGNVTGSVSDLGLTYYNPARLALIEQPAFTIGGKAYQWSRYQFDNILQTEKGLSSNSFGGIPATIAGTFSVKRLPNHKFAYSILSRHRSDIQLGYNSGLLKEDPIQILPDIQGSFTDLSFKDQLREEWFGVTWAHSLSEHFAVGASLFGSIYEIQGRADILINEQRENNSVIAYNNRLSYQQKTHGLFLRLGAAWQWSGIDLGMNVSLPFTSLRNKTSFTYLESLSGFSAEEDFIVAEEFGGLKGQRKTPLGIALGAGVPWKKNKLHFNMEWHGAVPSYERIAFPVLNGEASVGENPFREQLRQVFNFGAGAEVYLSESVNLIGSFSSDFSATEQGTNLFDLINQSSANVNLLDDFWHVALGVDLDFPWGNFTLGSSYAATSSRIDSSPEIPAEGINAQPRNFTTNISFERWRFIVGLEIPLIRDTLKNLPIPIQ
ncbi:hypothetical protein [Robiginitalea marina]|uniref:DUF5723 domain-containing protein n=1 Tax=Robiginitalea marina TaxID=2954105 RepID=A0ABT1B122_9FLAO|nr:hypothetical protein [Robiginitalea marina]MCO5725988.1 hypothetical protein [Robiginitalea marina]